MPSSALAKPPVLVDPRGRPLVRAQRADGWENSVTGFGTSRDKTTYGQFYANRVLSEQELSDLYHHSDMPRRIVDLLPSEMLREPFEVDVGDDGMNEAVAERLEQVDARSSRKATASRSRRFTSPGPVASARAHDGASGGAR